MDERIVEEALWALGTGEYEYALDRINEIRAQQRRLEAEERAKSPARKPGRPLKRAA